MTKKVTNHKKEWLKCKSCGRPFHKDRGCLICEPKENKDSHYFVEDDILAYQYHCLKKTREGTLFYLENPLSPLSYRDDGGVKNE